MAQGGDGRSVGQDGGRRHVAWSALAGVPLILTRLEAAKAAAVIPAGARGARDTWSGGRSHQPNRKVTKTAQDGVIGRVKSGALG